MAEDKERRLTRKNAKNMAVRTGSGAKRMASSSGRRMKQRVINLNERMVAIEWTPKKMIHEFMKFNITGTFNTAFAFLLYEIFYWLNLWDSHRAVAAWVVSAFIGQVEAHFMHYRYTFKSGVVYLTSLKWAVICYSSLLVVSTISEYILVEQMFIHHRFAWAINTCMFGFINFALIRWLSFPPEQDLEHLRRIEEE